MGQTVDRALHDLLKAAGCIWVRNGRHPVYNSPVSGLNFPVPVNIKSKHTANTVLKQAGLQKAF